MVLYRGIKPEMKHFQTLLTHSSTTNSVRRINLVPNGSGLFERQAAKIKIHHIEMVLASTESIRMTILLPNNEGATPSLTYAQSVTRENDNVIKDVFLHSGSSPDARGALVQHKLPLGMVSKFNGTAGTDINSNVLWVVLNQPSNGTITGYFRIWFTDV